LPLCVRARKQYDMLVVEGVLYKQSLDKEMKKDLIILAVLLNRFDAFPTRMF
jgi:hypothetical protein